MKRLKNFYGLLQVFLYAVVVTGLGMVARVVFLAHFDGIIEEWFCKGSHVLMLIYIALSAHSDLERSGDEKRWIMLDLKLDRGGMEDSFFRERGMCYSEQITFVERAIVRQILDIESVKIKE